MNANILYNHHQYERFRKYFTSDQLNTHTKIHHQHERFRKYFTPDQLNTHTKTIKLYISARFIDNKKVVYGVKNHICVQINMTFKETIQKIMNFIANDDEIVSNFKIIVKNDDIQLEDVNDPTFFSNYCHEITLSDTHILMRSKQFDIKIKGYPQEILSKLNLQNIKCYIYNVRKTSAKSYKISDIDFGDAELEFPESEFGIPINNIIHTINNNKIKKVRLDFSSLMANITHCKSNELLESLKLQAHVLNLNNFQLCLQLYPNICILDIEIIRYWYESYSASEYNQYVKDFCDVLSKTKTLKVLRLSIDIDYQEYIDCVKKVFENQLIENLHIHTDWKNNTNIDELVPNMLQNDLFTLAFNRKCNMSLEKFEILLNAPIETTKKLKFYSLELLDLNPNCKDVIDLFIKYPNHPLLTQLLCSDTLSTNCKKYNVLLETLSE